jgi:ABC-type transport system involved in multi-copper enzyme maturation permease subunit
LDALHRDFHAIPSLTFALVTVPVLAGMFWAAPLVSREYDAGTHRLAWTQSVSPLRWIGTKISLIFAVTALGALGLGAIATWALSPLAPAFGGRYNSTWYAVTGVVPVAYMVFALGVGVASSAWLRRTIPAMAVTLVIIAAGLIPVHWARLHFAPTITKTYSIPLTVLLQHPEGVPQEMFPSTLGPNDFLISTVITDPNGHVLNAPVNLAVLGNYCPNLQSPPPPESGRTGRGGGPINVAPPPPPSPSQLAACQSVVKNLSLHEKINYQPASHFWLIQAVESLIFTILAALLAAAGVAAILRRRPS